MILNDKQKTILQSFTRYRSPIDEESLYKGIDIRCLKLFKKHFKGLFIYRPRGGRYYIQNNECVNKYIPNNNIINSLSFVNK